MPQVVVMGAMMMCSFGMAPSTLAVIPKGMPVNAGGPLAANINDHLPIVNIPPFGMCITPTNPMVASATAAALGVLTPMPCIPVTSAPWVPGAPMTMINGAPALTNVSTCLCTWGGVITITMPGEMTVNAN
jgi:hypothetical protein